MSNERKIYIDLVKIFAICFVVFNHSGLYGFTAWQVNPDIFFRFVTASISCVVKVGVPLFYMCSGATLLSKDEDVKTLWIHRVLRYVLVLLLVEMGWYIFVCINESSQINFGSFYRQIYESQFFSYYGVFWFLYDYIAFLISLPIIRIIAKHLTKEIFIYIIVLYCIFSSGLPVIEFCLELKSFAISLPMICTNSIFYSLIGYYVSENVNQIRHKTSLLKLLIGISLFSIIISSWFSIYAYDKTYTTVNYLKLMQPFLVMCIFVLLYELSNRFLTSEKTTKLVSKMSKCTFGVYLIHTFIYYYLDKCWNPTNYFGVWIKVIAVLIISYLFVEVFLSLKCMMCICIKKIIKR